MRYDLAGSRLRARSLEGPLVYLAAWAAAGLAVVAVAGAVLGSAQHPGRHAAALPPIREIALGSAARKADCEVGARRPPRTIAVTHRPQPAGGIYERPVSADLRARAVHRGLIVIEYRPGVADASLATLKAMQQAAPRGTILAPSRVGARADVTATSFRRRLRCAEIGPATSDAVLLFRGRYQGSAPPT